MTDQPLSAPSEDAPQPFCPECRQPAPRSDIACETCLAAACKRLAAIVPEQDPREQEIATLRAALARVEQERDEARARLDAFQPADDIFRELVAQRDSAQAQIATLTAQDERLRAAERLAYGDDTTFGCDGADHLAELVLSLRAQIAALTTRAEQATALLQRVIDTGLGVRACADVRAYLAQPSAAAGTGETTE